MQQTPIKNSLGQYWAPGPEPRKRWIDRWLERPILSKYIESIQEDIIWPGYCKGNCVLGGGGKRTWLQSHHFECNRLGAGFLPTLCLFHGEGEPAVERVRLLGWDLISFLPFPLPLLCKSSRENANYGIIHCILSNYSQRKTNWNKHEISGEEQRPHRLCNIFP